MRLIDAEKCPCIQCEDTRNAHCTYEHRSCKKFCDWLNTNVYYVEFIGNEKEIAKKPEYEGNGYCNGELVLDTWICPNCGKSYEVDYDDYDYCPNCGQHIDHSNLTADD